MSVEKCYWSIVAIVSFIFTFGAGVMAGMQQQRCHVCVSASSAAEVQQVFPGAVLVPCQESSETRLCPPIYKGCLTQTGAKGPDGRLEKTLSCALLAIDVCRVANGVEYCYCSGQLCNASRLPTATTLTDDEDYAEGSGRGYETTTIVPSTTTIVPSTTTTLNTTTTGNHLSSASLLSASLMTTLLVLPLVCR